MKRWKLPHPHPLSTPTFAMVADKIVVGIPFLCQSPQLQSRHGHGTPTLVVVEVASVPKRCGEGESTWMGPQFLRMSEISHVAVVLEIPMEPPPKKKKKHVANFLRFLWGGRSKESHLPGGEFLRELSDLRT